MVKTLMSNEDLKRIVYSMFKQIDAICRKENIRYYVIGGTLLGCIRSKGFIPWDDDIDIGMFPEDYNRFIEYFNNNDIEGLRLDCLENNELYPYPYAKVSNCNTLIVEKKIRGYDDAGVFIDIFRIDYRGDNSRGNKIRNRMIRYQEQWLSSFLVQREKANNIIKDIYYKLRYTWRNRKSTRRWAEIIDEQSMVENEKKDREGYCASIHDKLIPCRVFYDVVYMPFEDMMVPCPAGYDEYLKIKFDDYWKLPPEQDRVSVHSFDAYYRREG